MKKFIKRFISLLMVCVIIVGFVPMEKANASIGTIKGIDYNRILSYNNDFSYPVSVSVGCMTFKGEIKRTAKIDKQNLDGYIEDFIKANKIDITMLENCQAVVEDYQKKAAKLKRDAGFDLAKIIAERFNADKAVDIIQRSVETVIAEKDYINELGVDQFYTKEHLLGVFSRLTQKEKTTLYGASTTVAKTIVDVVKEDAKKLGKKVSGKIKFVSLALTVVDLTKYLVDYTEKFDELDDLMRDSDRCFEYLSNFYNRLNYYLDRLFAGDATFVLRVNGKQSRRFNFLGTNNTQTWNLFIYMNRTRSYGVSTYSPAGEYEGIYELNLAHNMGGFDYAMWNLPTGPFPWGWYNRCDKMYIDGLKVYDCMKTGSSYIRRFIHSEDAKLTIYADNGVYGLGRTDSYTLNAQMTMDGLKDEITTSSSQKVGVKTSINFSQESRSGSMAVGHVDADCYAHLQGNSNGTFTLVLDSSHGNAQVLTIKNQVNNYSRVLGEVWDSNIWKPLENKKVSVTVNVNAQKWGGNQ